MRDPKRIDEVLQRLGELWRQHPDMRLGQLVANLTRDPRSGATSAARCFNLEDEQMMMAIVTVIENGWPR